MTREEFDALLAAALQGMVVGVDPESDDATAAAEEVQLLRAEAEEFADAVDRDGKRIPYGEAVVLEGANGVAVVTARTYFDAPLYWQTVAGKLDRLTHGTQLLEVLQVAANRAPAATD